MRLAAALFLRGRPRNKEQKIGLDGVDEEAPASSFYSNITKI
jgi:hypothetical protein